MSHARVYHTLTMLADGTVLAVGGEPTAQTGTVRGPGGVLPSEIWNPDTETWTPVASIGATRGLPLDRGPDARRQRAGRRRRPRHSPGRRPVLGADLLAGVPVRRARADDHLGARTRPPTARPFTVSTPDAASISAVNLVSLGADTHQTDMDQHFVPLQLHRATGR